MSNDDYTNDPAFYLTIAGGCSTLVCCLVCIAKHWMIPPIGFQNNYIQSGNNIYTTRRENLK